MKKIIGFVICLSGLVLSSASQDMNKENPLENGLRVVPFFSAEPDFRAAPRITEIRREFYLDAEKTQWCGSTIRTCQGYILKEGCCEESLYPTPYYDIFVDPCF